MTPDRATRAKGSRTLGVVAFGLACLSLVAGGAIQFFAGHQLGGIARFPGVADIITGGGHLDPAALPEAARAVVADVNTLSIIGFAAWLLLALWAIVQGIVAIVRRRGRAWGVAALAVAVAGYVVVQVAYGAGLILGMAPYV